MGWGVTPKACCARRPRLSLAAPPRKSAMDDRYAILARLKNTPTRTRPLPDAMHFRHSSGSEAERFTENLIRMGGDLLPLDGALAVTIRARYGDQATIHAPRAEPGGLLDFSWHEPPKVTFDQLDLVIVRAAFGVAETGSVCLTEVELGVEALGYLPQHLLVLLDPSEIVADLHAAFVRPEWTSSRYGVLQSGPSATADIEGVLIRGAQGVRSLCVALLPRVTP